MSNYKYPDCYLHDRKGEISGPLRMLINDSVYVVGDTQNVTLITKNKVESLYYRGKKRYQIWGQS